MNIIKINFNSERHMLYKKNWDIYENNPDFKRNKDKYIKVPLAQEIAHLYRDIGFKSNVQANVKDNAEVNQALDRIFYENRLDSLISEAAVTNAVKGEVIFKNYLDDGVAKISIVEPDYYFPELDKFNQRKVIRETIAMPYVEDDKELIYQEIYEKREDGYYWCIMKTSTFDNGEVGEDLETEEVNTNLTKSPLTHVVYSRNNKAFFGNSIYKGLYDLLEEYNWRVSEVSKILDKHSNPSIIGSSSLLDEDYKFRKDENGLFIPVDDGEQKPEYLTWESQLNANKWFIEDGILKALYFVSILNPALLGLTNESSNTSARAVKLKAFRSASVIENSLKHWIYALKKVLYLAQELEVSTGAYRYEPTLPNIEISPSLPVDDYESAQAEQLKIMSGNTSIKSSIARLNPNYTASEIEEEYLEIINEQNDSNIQTFAQGFDVDEA